MKYFLFIIISVFTVSSFGAELTPEILKEIEKRYGIEVQNFVFTKENVKTKFVRDSENTLRATNQYNFLLIEESEKAKNIKDLMRMNGGSRVGNGGDVISCRNGEIIEVLDSYRAKNYSSKKLELVRGNSFEESLSSIIKKLKNSFPHLGKSLSKFYQEFKTRETFSDMVFWSPEKELVDVKDELLFSVIPKDCKLIQAVVRLKTKRKVFFYNKSIMTKIKSTSNQLSWLIVHEWLWDYLKNAKDVRDANHYLHSKSFQNALENNILKYLNSTGFNIDKKNSFLSLESKHKVQKLLFETFNKYLYKFRFKRDKKDLDYLKFYASVSETTSKIDTDKSTTRVNSIWLRKIIRKITDIYTNRLKELHETTGFHLEKWYLREVIDIIKRLIDDDRGLLSHFISGTYSVFQIKILSEVSIAKVTVQRKAWFILPSFARESERKVREADIRFQREEISLQEYIELIFKAGEVSMPKRFKNL